MNEFSPHEDPSCADDTDPHSLLVEAALEKIKADIQPVSDHEIVLLHKALNRVLTDDIHSTIDMPAAANSAMDGYAISSLDIPENGAVELRVIGTSWAGIPLGKPVETGACSRIMTGALLPEGTDTVVMQENTYRNKDTITISAGISQGTNVRIAGEDFTKGDLIVKAGTHLGPAHIGLIAASGISEVKVYRNIRVAFFATGDELRSIGESLAEGCIYDSNRYALFAMLSRLGVEITDLGVIKDNRQAIKEAFHKASTNTDAVITTGGVSVGDADFVKETLAKIGEIRFWKVAMKPGRPLAFGKINNACFFGLPGNPVSMMVTFYQFVQPALKQMMGSQDSTPLTFRVICTSYLKKRPGRMEYQRGVLSRGNSGQLTVRKTGAQGSGMLSSMAQANCFIILPIENDGIAPGETVEVQPFFGIV